jgi:enoyl-CoA hydratase
MTDALVVEQRGHVLLLRLNRPEARNALTHSLLTALGQALLRAETDPGIRVVVLTGTGERAFCAGMDLRTFNDGSTELSPADQDRATDAWRRLFAGTITVPLVGAANATAAGGGLELLLGCDLVVGAREARFGFPEVKVGLFPGGGGTFVGARIGLGRALELLLTGDLVDADRALELGLLNAAVPAAEVLDTALGYAERIAANAPLGVAAVKELARLGATDHAAATRRLTELQVSVFGSADAKEGAVAFAEKRAPVWQGR